MKIRNGFVSNSSSSSFVIDATEQTVLEIAFSMVPARNWDEKDTELQEKLLTLIDAPDRPIAFQSCNFDTFIKKVNNIIFVETCNNHMWSDFIDYRCATKEEAALIEDYEFGFSISRNRKQGNRMFKNSTRVAKNENPLFCWPEFGIYAKTLSPDYDWCKNCLCNILELEDGKQICPNCKKNISEVGRYYK